jgi:hypothetical protein
MIAKSEAELLMNDLLPFAKRLLAEFGEFHPFGGKMLSDGTIVRLGADTGEEFPSASRLIVLMKADFAAAAASRAIRCAAIIAGVWLHRAHVDAIEVFRDHAEGYSAEVFFPYVIKDGALEVRPPFARRGRPFVFGGTRH